MKDKKNVYVKKETEKGEENSIKPEKELPVEEQLELFADIIIDIYFESTHEKANGLKE